MDFISIWYFDPFWSSRGWNRIWFELHILSIICPRKNCNKSLLSILGSKIETKACGPWELIEMPEADLDKKVLLNVIFRPLRREAIFKSYKIMPRSQVGQPIRLTNADKFNIFLLNSLLRYAVVIGLHKCCFLCRIR